MNWRVDHTTVGFDRPLTACDTCGGEGYDYAEIAGRHATHPVIERQCRTCGGTGVKP